MPVTPFDRSTCSQAGLLLVPVFERYRVALAFLARAERTLVADPYRRSPCATDGMLAPPVVASVPLVGNVTEVAPVIVNVVSNAPEVVRLPPSVIASPVFATPVPPRAPDSVPVHPAVIDAAESSAVVGEPPNVRVTLVSSAFVRAAPLAISLAASCETVTAAPVDDCLST